VPKLVERAELRATVEPVAQDLLNVSRVGAHQRHKLVHERAYDRIHRGTTIRR